MGETGLRAAIEAVCYLLGEPVVGVPTLRTVDPNLAEVQDAFTLQNGPIAGVPDGGVISTVQGFGGYVGALALRAATPDALRRYTFEDGSLLSDYLERWSELRKERVERETRMRRTRGMALALAEQHAYPGLAR
jgi:hypothetical protein